MSIFGSGSPQAERPEHHVRFGKGAWSSAPLSIAIQAVKAGEDHHPRTSRSEVSVRRIRRRFDDLDVNLLTIHDTRTRPHSPKSSS